MDQAVRHQLADRHLWIDSDLLAECLADRLVLRQLRVDERDRRFKGDGIPHRRRGVSPLPLGVRPAIAPILDDPQSFPPQPLELVEVGGEQNRPQVGDIESIAGLGHDEPYVRQLAQDTSLISRKRDAEQLGAPVEIQQRQHLRPVEVGLGDPGLEWLARQNRPQLTLLRCAIVRPVSGAITCRFRP